MSLKRPKTEKTKVQDALMLLASFRREDGGSITIFSLFLFIMIVAITGLSIDYSRAERNRTLMQNTLDRAILAAADLDQERPAQDVVNDYFEAAGLESTLSAVHVEEGLNYKVIAVEADITTTAPFLDLMNHWVQVNRNLEAQDLNAAEIDRYRWHITNPEEAQTGVAGAVIGRDANAAEELAGLREPVGSTITTSVFGEAEERVSNVEISLVLDVSGSMSSNNRMTNLKAASNEFLDTVLAEGTEDLISVSIVPYDEHVSLGNSFYNSLRSELSVNHKHNYSHCIEFPDSEFDQTNLEWNTTYQQMQHTRLYSSWGFQCSTDSDDDVTPISQDLTALKAQVNALQPSGNTHVFMGMKWAAALLDPSFNVAVDDLVADNIVEPAFDNRPAAFDDPETLKTIVLMTDGQNTSSYRVVDRYYATPSHYAHWNSWGILSYLNRYVSSWRHSQFYYTKYNSTLGDTLLDNICDAAKSNGIVIWSIGFEINDHGANVMESCASSPSHFFRVEGIEISDAFDAIARQINQLRLTQ